MIEFDRHGHHHHHNWHCGHGNSHNDDTPAATIESPYLTGLAIITIIFLVIKKIK